jgi:hypothetical protein
MTTRTSTWIRHFLIAQLRPYFALTLPHSLLVRVLAALPADTRLRCAEVCKTWRAAVSDRSLWLRVDLSRESGVTRAVTAALLRAVATRAAGHVQTLVLPSLQVRTCFAAVLEVLRANRASIRELDITVPFEASAFCTQAIVEPVLDAAPQLQLFRVDLTASLRESVRMLRDAAPHGPLRVCLLQVLDTPQAEEEEDEEGSEDDDLLALIAAMRQDASLKGVSLVGVPLDTPAELDAFIDAALAQRFSQLGMQRCNLSPASAPALARLLGSTTLTHLTLINNAEQLWDAPAAMALADALRANTTLRWLMLGHLNFWEDADGSAAVLTSLTGHPSVQKLYVVNNEVQAAAAPAAGAALGALVAANAPALSTLNVSFCFLGDAGLAPLLDVLPRNTHLRKLRCLGSGMSAAFARDTFLPAIRANTSLRQLLAAQQDGDEYDEYEDVIAPLHQAEALVKTRAAADTRPV